MGVEDEIAYLAYIPIDSPGLVTDHLFSRAQVIVLVI
jgi:hypothetical protein